jgi:hypothetical protein
MPAQGHTPDVIDTMFGNPLLKGVMAALGALAAIARYIKESGERSARAATIGNRYDLHGPIYFTINRFPHALHRIVAIAILVVAFLEVCVLFDQYTLNRAVMAYLPTVVQATVDLFSRHFVGLVLVALGFWALFEFRAIERLMAWLFGLIPPFRNTLGWANAQWQISVNADDRRVLAPSEPQVDVAASRLIAELAGGPRNDSLALRPVRLSEDNVANVLYFGHVIEQYLSANGGVSLPWTRFYEALAEVAETKAAPFSPEGIKKFNRQTSYFAIILQANARLGDFRAEIPNDAGLEHAVETALTTLRDCYQSDARKLAAGCFRSHYARVLRAAASFLPRESMRRQFAKLFVLWNIVPAATHPEVFRIPFNAKMFMRYLDDGVIRVDGDHFDYTTEPVAICFEAVQKQILVRVLMFLNQTKDATRSQWREGEKADVNARHLDWAWWVYYRADQQAYHDARDYESEKWKVEGNEVVSR